MMNQVKTQEVKIGRSQIIAEVEVSENLTMDSDSYDELQLGAASDSWFSFLAPVPLLKYTLYYTLWKVSEPVVPL